MAVNVLTIRGVCIYVHTQQKIVKIPTVFYLMHGDMFRLCLQPPSGQLAVQSNV